MGASQRRVRGCLFFLHLLEFGLEFGAAKGANKARKIFPARTLVDVEGACRAITALGRTLTLINQMGRDGRTRTEDGESVRLVGSGACVRDGALNLRLDFAPRGQLREQLFPVLHRLPEFFLSIGDNPEGP